MVQPPHGSALPSRTRDLDKPQKLLRNGRGTWQRAQGVDPASTFPRSQSDGASVRCARTSPTHGSPTVEAWTQDLWGCPSGFLLFQGVGGGSFGSCGLWGGAFMDWTSPHKLNGIEIWGLCRHFLLFVVFLWPFLRSFHGPAWRSAGLLQSGSATVMMWWTWSSTVFGCLGFIRMILRPTSH